MKLVRKRGGRQTRIVYIRDPEKNYQFVAWGQASLREYSEYPYSILIPAYPTIRGGKVIKEQVRYVWEGP